MPDFSELADEAKKEAGEHPDQVQAGLGKAGDLVDDKTGGRFDDQVKDAEQEAGKFAGDDQSQNQGQNQ